MKKVFNPSELAHIWANQLQDQGRTTNNSMFFDGDTIYSYGRHFAIAKHVGKSDNNLIPRILFTTRRYSNTTAKHISKVSRAANHLQFIYVNDPSESPRLNFEAFKREIEGLLKGLDKARKPENYIQPAKGVYEQAVRYADFLGQPVPQELTDLINAVDTGEYKEYLVKESERLAKIRLEREILEQQQAKQELADWRAFEIDTMYHRLNDRDFLRIIVRTQDKKKIKRIQTSQGIEMPLEVARKAYNWAKLTIQAGGCNGDCHYKILEYEVKALSPELMVIGCHKIDMPEIDTIAKALNWNL